MTNPKRPYTFFTRWIRHLRNEYFLRRWVTRRDGDTTGNFYIKRHYELNFAFYDVYWYIKSVATRQRAYTHYVRIDEAVVRSKIKEIEEKELPLILENIQGEGEINDLVNTAKALQ